MPTSGIYKLFVEGIFKIWLTRLVYSYFLLAFFKMSWCPGSAPYFWLGYIVNEVSSVPIRFWNYISQFIFLPVNFNFLPASTAKPELIRFGEVPLPFVSLHQSWFDLFLKSYQLWGNIKVRGTTNTSWIVSWETLSPKLIK